VDRTRAGKSKSCLNQKTFSARNLLSCENQSKGELWFDGIGMPSGKIMALPELPFMPNLG